jgi:hypothetical protein
MEYIAMLYGTRNVCTIMKYLMKITKFIFLYYNLVARSKGCFSAGLQFMNRVIVPYNMPGRSPNGK